MQSFKADLTDDEIRFENCKNYGLPELVLPRKRSVIQLFETQYFNDSVCGDLRAHFGAPQGTTKSEVIHESAQGTTKSEVIHESAQGSHINSVGSIPATITKSILSIPASNTQHLTGKYRESQPGLRN